MVRVVLLIIHTKWAPRLVREAKCHRGEQEIWEPVTIGPLILLFMLHFGASLDGNGADATCHYRREGQRAFLGH